MEFAILLFLSVLGAIIKRCAIPAILVVAAVAGITALAGGSWLLAAGITAGIAVVVAVISAFAALSKPW